MKALTILLAVVCGTLAAPSPALRKSSCENSESRFVPSKKYVYRYVGTSTTGIQGTTDEKAEIKIEARFHVNSVSSCVFHLEVDNVKLLERSSPDTPFKTSKGDEKFVQDLEGSYLTFTVMNGKILDIKIFKEDPVYVTNIMRGMLSALQLEFKEEGESTVEERDIAGDCKTRYLRITKDNKEDVYKVKNLTECTNRSDMDTLMHPVFYTTGSDKRTPLHSTSVCHYQVANKQINSVECKETHLLRPLSYKSAGVMTTVTQKIVLVKASSFLGYRSCLQDASSERSDLRFDFQKQKLQQSLQGDTSSVDKILRDLVEKKLSKETSWMAPLGYTKLVFQMRRLDNQGIADVWRKFYNHECSVYRHLCSTRDQEEQKKYNQLLVDALSQCGTEACVEFIVQQIRQIVPTPDVYRKGINNDMKQLLSGLTWVRNPTEKILDDVWMLVKEKDDILPENTITFLGSMIRTHCDVYPKNCKDDLSGLDHIPKVLEISRFIGNKLYMNVDLCKATHETVDEMIYVLRAIGNSRYMESSPIDLVYCALQSNYKNVSVVALQVLRDMKLDYQTRKELRKVYKDYTQDPEIRMMAYLVWMKEPTKDDIKTVVETLDGEIDTQVGSLVWSHLTSMNTSVGQTSGKRIGNMIKEVLRETQKTLRSFNTTSKSTVWHKSTFNEKQNLGISADTHVLYHPESLLPRHTHLNISADVLGGSFPVLEASTRTEGLELLWDRLFGPTGHFPESHLSYLVKVPPEEKKKEKRSIDDDENELQYLHDRVNMPRPIPSGLFSIKLFGNDLALFTLKDLEWLEHEVPMLDWVDLLQDLKMGVDKTFTKQLLFLEDSFTIPTSIGLPLTLSLNGTAVGSIRMIAQGDLRNLFVASEPDIVFKGSVKPSAAVTLSGMMSVNAFHSEAGILVNSTLFTLANISANVTYKKNEKLKFHYNVVEQPQEIFNISSMLFKQVNNEKTPISGIKQRKKASVCMSSIFNMTKYVGMDLCSNISVPVSWDKTEVPFLPLTGPANFTIKLHRADPKLTTYKLEINETKVSEFFNKTSLELSTPGSTHKRILLMNLTTPNQKGRSQWNISVGDHEANWTAINFTRDSTSETLMAELNITLSNTSLYHTTTVHKPVHDLCTIIKNRWTIIKTSTSLTRGPYGRPVTLMFLNATLNYCSMSKGRMVFNLTHLPLDFTWQVKVKHNKPKTNIACFMRCKKRPSPLLNHIMVFNITHINTTSEKITEKGLPGRKISEKGLRFEMRINDTRRMSFYGSKKVVRTISHKLSTYFTNFTFYNRTTLNPYTTSLNFTLHENLVTRWNNMVLNMTYKNHSFTLETTMKNSTKKKSICLNGTYINGTSWNNTNFTSCIVLLNDTKVKHLIWNLTSFNTTHKLETAWFVRPRIHFFVNYICQNESLANLTVSYKRTRSVKSLDVNGGIGNWTLDLQHSYEDLMRRSHKLKRILIIHKAKNRTEPYMYNAFNLTFFNSTTMKNMLVGLTLSTRTVDTLELELPRQFVNKTVSWRAEIKNDAEILNVSSLLDYQVMDNKEPNKLISKKKLNHTLFWNKPKSFLNMSLDLPSATLGLNCSGTFIKGIKMSANMNDTLLWNTYASQWTLISNVTLWNRTVVVESRTYDKSQSSLLNISTWVMANRTALNGSFTWYLNPITKRTNVNITLVNVNVTLLNTTFVNIKNHLKNLTDVVTFFLRNLTSNIPYYLRNASKDIGEWEIHSKTIDSHIKEILPELKDKMLYMLNETAMVITEIHEHLRILRDDVAFLSDHFVKETYPEVHKYRKDFYNKIKKLGSPTSFFGGILHPCWMNISEMLNTSIFNITVQNLHQYLINGTTFETVIPFLSQPNHITKVFYESVLDSSLEKVLNSSLNKAMEMYNVTLRLPSWHVNKTHDNIVYARDLMVMFYNDTDNVMNSISRKNLVEIVDLYMNQTRKIATTTWNLTMPMAEAILNLSIPAHRRWKTLKPNLTELYWNTSEKMPWARPLVRLWNTTMLNLAKNNTPEKLIEDWMPKFVNFTLDQVLDFTKYVNKCLIDEQTQTPRIQMTYSRNILSISMIERMESRPNSTKYFFEVSKHYQKFTKWMFNMTKEPKMKMPNTSQITMEWVDVFFNSTSKYFDDAESVVNFSLVNEKINNLTNEYVKSSPMIMEVPDKVLNKTVEMVFNKSNIPYYSAWNTMNKVWEMEAHKLAILLTPKNQTAFVINQRNYITFDKRSFRVPEFPKSGCSVLVARDFLEGHFTVLATQNSYIIVTPDSNIEIYKGGRIKANTKYSSIVVTDLPVQFEDIYAIRDGPYIRVTSEERGFEFELEVEHFIFGAYISGFFHNRTLGLLGTNNGEISDDWLSPLGKNRTGLEKFLNSWLVSRDQECLIKRPVQRQQCQPRKLSRCEELLKSKDSPFQKCFDVIDPKAFLEACIKDVSSCENLRPERTSHCSVSAAYVRACVKNGVIISMPTQCADCYENGRFIISRKEVDIVVISSEGTNMKRVVNRIPKLISRINMDLINDNISPRFGLVGFSGRPPVHWKGHTHTLNGNFLGSQNELYKGIETLDFAPWQLYTNISDGYMGIYHATKYPFRPGAKKIFLLVTDSRRVPDSDLTSDVVSEAMRNIDAKLIVIGDYYFKSKMYGGDTERYRYYFKHPEGIIHKSGERLPEEDEYVKIVLKTKGAVFSVKRFENDKTNKHFSEMVNNVVRKYSKGKSCLQCRCVPDEVGKGREVCKVTSNFWCNWN